MRHFAILIVVAFAYGCSGESSDTPRQGHRRSTYSINGKSPSEFYAQFHYKEGRKSDGNEEFTVFNYVSSDSQKVGESLSLEDQKCARFKLAINEDQTFVLKYKEEYCLQSSDRPRTWDPVFEKRKSGQWSIDAMTLKLGDVATATGFELNDAPTLRVQFARSINLELPPNSGFIGHYRVETVFPFDGE